MDIKQLTQAIHRALELGDAASILPMFKFAAKPHDTFSQILLLNRALEKIPVQLLNVENIKVAILPTCTVDYLVVTLRFWLKLNGLAPEFFIADFNSIEQTVLDPDSSLYAFEPDIIWIFTTGRDIRVNLPLGALENQVYDALEQECLRWKSLWSSIQNRCSARIIQNNADLPLERIFGNLEGSAPWTHANYLRRFNLMISQDPDPNVTLFDLDFLSSVFGKQHWFQERYWHHAKILFSHDACVLTAHRAAGVIGAMKGRSKKVLVVDLDNTIWGGIIGDDGLTGIQLGDGARGEAFVSFQNYLISLKNRGILLAVCSKNSMENARLPFEKHPEMRLKLDDFSVFVANWDNKAENLNRIAQTLTLGLDAIVFADDNPVERDLVRQALPQVAVPELPQDPADYVRVIDAQGYFETLSFSREDQDRHRLYASGMKRNKAMKEFTDMDQFLVSLDMRCVSGAFDQVNLPRISQLINKSNQFHLTTTRYNPGQIQRFMKTDLYVCRYFRLIDRFCDNGLSAAVILKNQDHITLVIDTWVMSCRILSRTMEHHVMNSIIDIALKNKFKKIKGIYKPSPKNGMTKDLYKNFGFSFSDDSGDRRIWELKLTNDLPLHKTFITRDPQPI